jgi:hypothetical protein
MSDANELAYRRALELLRTRGKNVQEPYNCPDGVRRVQIDGFPCTDEFVLTEAWGPTRKEALSSEALVTALEQIFGAGKVELRSEDAICVFASPDNNSQGRMAKILTREQAKLLATHPVLSEALAALDFPPGWPIR